MVPAGHGLEELFWRKAVGVQDFWGLAFIEILSKDYRVSSLVHYKSERGAVESLR